jgi:ubiquilin
MSERVTVVIKPTGQSSDKPDRFNVSVPADSTVLQLKEEVSKSCGLAADEQRLIYKGKILKDHETVAFYGAVQPSLHTKEALATAAAFFYHR